MFLARPACLAFALTALATLSAANTLTVGPAGSGAQFTEIQAAIDAAQDDDVILVMPGTYQQIVATKPLRILGDGTGTVTIAAPAQGVTVRDIPAGEEFVLSGIDVIGSDGTANMEVLLFNCQGTVILHDAVVVTASDSGSSGLRVEFCPRVMVLDSRIAGCSGCCFFSPPEAGGGIWAVRSTLWIANSTITCEGGFPLSSPGVHALNSTLHVWRTSIRGVDYGGVVQDLIGADGGEGIRAISSTLNLFGGPGSAILGGQGSFVSDDGEGGTAALPGGLGLRLSQGSHARVQASLPILGGWDGSHTHQSSPVLRDSTSTIEFDAKTFASLASTVQQAPIGSSFRLTLDGNAGGYQVLYMSLRTGPTSIFHGVDGFGMLLDRANLFRFVSEILPASGSFTTTVNVPSTLALIGSTLFFQNVERFPDSAPRHLNRFSIGNPVLVTITP